MESHEFTIRIIKDRIVAAAGVIEESAPHPGRRDCHKQISDAATELHKCADELQNLMMRIKHR